MARPDPIHRVLAIRSTDPILHHIAPLGLAAAAGRCLIIDLDPAAPGYSQRTLADLVSDGPTAADLATGPGVALLGNGGIRYEEAASMIDRLVALWGRVVVRDGRNPHPFRVLSVEPLLPAPFTPAHADVVQAVAFGQGSSGRPVLPPLRRHQIRSLLSGTIESRWRWTRAWAAAWREPWE
jgi:hypothetical protein